MIWFFRDPARYQTEADAIATLEASASWLTVRKWDFGEGARLVCEADIAVGERVFPVTLRYNHGFPAVPPSVLPRIPERWSGHQFGDRELCLEYGPDNWVPQLRGADLLASAFRLLESEAAIPDQATPRPVPSRHSLTLGQELRGRSLRLLMTPALQSRSEALASVTPARFAVRIRKDTWVAYPVAFQVDGVEWNDPQVPASDVEYTEFMSGLIVRRAEGIGSPPTGDVAEFRQTVLGDPPGDLDLTKNEFLLFLTDAGPRAFYLWRKGNAVFEFPATIKPDSGVRQEPDYACLTDKRVGLIGCGSMGSKVAATLARAGVGRFVLADDDILRPENLVRNDLDWTAVGEHKAPALARRLRLINPAIAVESRQHRLGGQEASTGLDTLMFQLSSCDIIIDATATSEAFNLGAAAATQGEHPLLWAEVFAGGIGGAIARSRPGIEPSPQEARKRMLAWYRQQGVEVPTTATTPYTGGTGETSQIADDADVSVIAAHLSQLAIDTLLARTPSRFPNSAYVIGLQAAWIFTQPFDTAPIDLGLPDPAVPPDETDPKWHEGMNGLAQLIEAARAASTNNS